MRVVRAFFTTNTDFTPVEGEPDPLHGQTALEELRVERFLADVALNLAVQFELEPGEDRDQTAWATFTGPRGERIVEGPLRLNEGVWAALENGRQIVTIAKLMPARLGRIGRHTLAISRADNWYEVRLRVKSPRS
ncbi:MAG: hypothetical protein JWN99_383 [Ilumatobacteraceae bacterium]|nr:hypothetical protein [Ilumatobacteraceae bacterium]